MVMLVHNNKLLIPLQHRTELGVRGWVFEEEAVGCIKGKFFWQPALQKGSHSQVSATLPKCMDTS